MEISATFFEISSYTRTRKLYRKTEESLKLHEIQQRLGKINSHVAWNIQNCNTQKTLIHTSRPYNAPSELNFQPPAFFSTTLAFTTFTSPFVSTILRIPSELLFPHVPVVNDLPTIRPGRPNRHKTKSIYHRAACAKFSSPAYTSSIPPNKAKKEGERERGRKNSLYKRK